jgi:hypothetical protein
MELQHESIVRVRGRSRDRDALSAAVTNPAKRITVVSDEKHRCF